MSDIDGKLAQLAPQLTALRCAFLIALHHDVQLPADALPELVEGDMAGPVTAALARAGFRTREILSAGWKKAVSLGSAYPAIAIMKDNRWVILVAAVPAGEDQGLAVLDPERETEGLRVIDRAAFEPDWSGRLILVRHAPAMDDAHRPFGFGWFVPELLRQRSLLWGVAAAAIVSNLVSFAIPLLMQVLIDRVIAHQAWNTLTVIVTVFVLLASFDAGFAYVRQRLMAIAGGKVDARLGSRAFAHLMGLPLTVFETQAAGVLTRHLQQTEKVRQFLTGRLFQTLLDAAFLPVLLTLLVAYSATLTAVVLGFALVIAGSIGVALPFFRRRLTALYIAEGERQAHLVETLHNMRAVKALVLEPARQKGWDRSLAGSVRRQWDVATIAAFAGALTGWFEKMMQIAVLALGAVLVFEGNLSLGALVAFTMLSTRVTGPLLQIVGLINEYQEAVLSLKMLGEVMNRAPENSGQARPARPPITGDLRFEGVGFTYAGAASPALSDVSFRIAAGQVIGVVGRSGSGKTTLTRLLQGVEVPQAGAIRADGVDIRHIDLGHLRRSVGVVLQENLLFRGTLRENIAAARPSASLDEVQTAARLAGAEEFIRRLPMAYETRVEEGGANLSGGQRQRIAIARALLTAPRVLIFDEATSALDPESEALINRNLARIAEGRTMIVVSHRLSSLVRADAILVLDAGRVVDIAPHEVLLGRCPIYRGLWDQQTEHMR